MCTSGQASGLIMIVSLATINTFRGQGQKNFPSRPHYVTFHTPPADLCSEICHSNVAPGYAEKGTGDIVSRRCGGGNGDCRGISGAIGPLWPSGIGQARASWALGTVSWGLTL